MLETAHALIRKVALDMGLGDLEVEQLLKADALHRFDITLSTGQTFPAYRAQHSNKLGPYKGGVRFHPSVSEDEVLALATLMSLKTAAIGLPLGGGKGGVTVNPKKLSFDQLEEISRAYVKHLLPHIGPDKDIPAPDVNTNPQIMDWMADEYSSLTGDITKASFTGKSLGKGGSEGRNAATGRGGVIALAELLKLTGKAKKPLAIALQGFGNVGSFFAKIAAEEHPLWQFVAVSDSGATLHNSKGLSVKEVTSFKQGGGRFKDFSLPHATIKSAETITSLNADILVLAALEGAVNNANAAQVKASIIVELANGPVDEGAYELLKKDKIILPDIIANAGGVIVSFLEWQQNKLGKSWSEEQVNRELIAYMTKAVQATYSLARDQSIPLKDAAFRLALERLTRK